MGFVDADDPVNGVAPSAGRGRFLTTKIGPVVRMSAVLRW